MRPSCSRSGPHQARSAAPSFERRAAPYRQRPSPRRPSGTDSALDVGGCGPSIARSNRVACAVAWAAEFVAHAAENRPHIHIDLVIGKSRDPAVGFQGTEVIEISFDAEDPVARQQQLTAEADGPADLGAGCVERHGTDGALEMVVNPRKCHAALEVPHPAADGDADAWRHRCEPFHFGGPLVIRKPGAGTEDRLLHAGPGAAGLDTEEPAGAHLPVIAGVATGEPTVDRVIVKVDTGLDEINVAKAPAA